MKIYDLVKELLYRHRELRSSDKSLLWAVWYEKGLIYQGTLSREGFLSAPSSESITRARRKVQENHPELQAVKSVKQERKRLEDMKGFHVYHE